jgi:Flp pilus assembly secretin CpaC
MKWSQLLLVWVLFAPCALASGGEQASQTRGPESDRAAKPSEDSASQQIRIHLKICELSLTKLQQLNLDLAELGLDRPSPDPRTTVQGKPGKAESPLLVGSANTKTAAGLVEILRREGILKVLPASGQATLLDGQTAYFVGGSRGPKSSFLGHWVKEEITQVQVEVTATLTKDRQIRLRILAKGTEVDPSVSITLNGAKLPGIKTHEMLAPCEMALGTTAVVAGLVRQGIQDAGELQTDEESKVRNDVLTLLLITPELVEPVAD